MFNEKQILGKYSYICSIPVPAQPANGFSPLIFNNDLLVNHYRRLLHPVAAAVPRLPNGANGYNDVPDTQLKMGQRGKTYSKHNY